LTSAIRDDDAGNRWPGFMEKYYTGHIAGNEIAYSVLSHVNTSRVIEAPYTEFNTYESEYSSNVYKTNAYIDAEDSCSMPFVFMYDSKLDSVTYEQIDESFDGKSESEIDSFKLKKKWIIPKNIGIEYSLGNDNTVVNFDKPQFEREIMSLASSTDDENIQVPINFRGCEGRKVFMTCMVTTDMSVVFDYYNSSKRVKYNGMNLIGYHFDDSQNIILRVGALYPTPYDKNGHKVSYGGTGIITDTNIVDEEYVLADWNKFDANPDSFIKDISAIFIQTVIDMVDGLNTYKETLNADLGRLDLSYVPLDMIKEVKNSETDNDGSGYYDLDSYISTVNINLDGDSDSYITSITAENRSADDSILRSTRVK
jgi:hypothetical protein